MGDAIKPDPLTPAERELVNELSQRTSENRAELLFRAKNNQLCVNARVLAELDWNALDWLYTILAHAMDELMAELEERQHAAAPALQNRLDALPAFTLTIGVDEKQDEEEWNEACNRTLEAVALTGDMYGLLNPPKVRNKPTR